MRNTTPDRQNTMSKERNVKELIEAHNFLMFFFKFGNAAIMKDLLSGGGKKNALLLIFWNIEFS